MKNILVASVPSFSHMNGVAVDSLHVRTAESMSHKVGVRWISHHPFVTGHFPPAQASRAGVVTQKCSSISATWPRLDVASASCGMGGRDGKDLRH